MHNSKIFCTFAPVIDNTMQKMLRKSVLLVLLSVGCWVYGIDYTPATVPDPKKDGQEFYVSNPDAIIADSDVVFLNTCAQRLEKETQVELCVVALGSIGDADCFDFSYELFQRWGIGGKNKNTGVLMIFVLDSHDFRIMTGTGIEGVLTDALCSEIFRSLVPVFRAGDYGGGLCLGAMRIYEICTDGEAPEELKNMKSVTNRGKYAQMAADDDDDDDEDGWDLEGWILTFVVAFLIFLGIREKWLLRKKCPKCGKRTKLAKNEVKQNANYKHGGSGIYHYKCPKCGHEWSVPYTTPKLTVSSSSSSSSSSWSGSSYSSGSSGGSWGGGSTSGGGAGGKW